MKTARPRPGGLTSGALAPRARLCALCAALCLLAPTQTPSVLAQSNTTTTTTTTTGAGDSASASTPAPAAAAARCRTFYAHGEASRTDGLEYGTQLLWREHAASTAPDTRTLAVNVTATEGARVMLGSAARALPGQPHYELVLGATANASRLLVHGAHHIRGSGPAAPPPADDAALFEEGDLQMWLRWTASGDGANATGRLEVTALPAGRSEVLLLFNYTTNKPIQVETFSFGSTLPGDVAFTVCYSSGRQGGASDVHQQTGHSAAPGGLGVPGCRSLLVHVQNTYANVHNLAIDWAQAAHRHNQLQFWARASTDVEVVVSDHLHLKRNDPKYHVVYGGDFNTKTWVIGYEKISSRQAVAETPALLSDFQFRPLWLSLSTRGALKAGSGDLHVHGKNHTGAATEVATLLAWRHPHAPEPKFVTFSTFRQRMVHILIDCDESPSLAQPPQPYPSDLLDAVRSALASTATSATAAPLPLELDIERLSMHNGTLTATGSLVQDWSNLIIEWNPNWFDEVRRIQFWLGDFDESFTDASRTSVTSLSEDAETVLEPAILEINVNRTILWKFPLRLQMPCKHNAQNGSDDCSLALQINSKSKDCKVKALKNIHKWMVHWHTVKKNDSLQLHFIATTKHQQENQIVSAAMTTSFIPQRQYNAWLKFASTFLALASLALLILGNKHLFYQGYKKKWFSDVIAKSKRLKIILSQKEMEDNMLIVGYDGWSANIIGTNSEKLQDSEQSNEELSETQNDKYAFRGKERSPDHLTRAQRAQLLILSLITASLILSLMDLIISLK